MCKRRQYPKRTALPEFKSTVKDVFICVSKVHSDTFIGI